MKNQILMRGIKYRSKGKGRGFDFNIELDIPALGGNLDAKMIGGIFANETIDLIRSRWEKGLNVSGQPQRKKPFTGKERAVKKTLLTGAPADNREFTKWLSKRAKRDPKLKKRIRALRKDYRYLERGFKVLNGIKTRYSKKHHFVPEPKNPAVNSSGLMVASLKGQFKPSRKYRNKSTGKMVNVQSHVLLRVAKSRQGTAISYGLDRKNQSYLVSQLNSNTQHFRMSNQLVKNAVYWRDNKRAMVRALMVIRLMMKVAGAVIQGG